MKYISKTVYHISGDAENGLPGSGDKVEMVRKQEFLRDIFI
jgi:hypothetical protein